MECYDKGILSREELDGIDLKWGDGEAIVELMQKMADGDGIGEILMHGSAYAAKKLGKGEEYLQTTWGLELPMHDPRLAPGFARTYQYDPTPARHVKGGLGLPQLMGLGMPGNMESLREDNITKLDVKMTSFREVTNASGFCFFMDSGADPGLINNYIEAITGKVFSPETSYEAGFRIFTLRHAFNLREGLTRKDMQIAGRAVGKPLNEGQ